MARSGTEPLMFLHCNGYKKQPQKDCRTYLPDGKLTYANRYAVRSLSFDVDEIKNSFNNAAIFADFIKDDNGLKVLTMANLGYNRASHTLYVQ
jgi:hypothetical protein